MQKRPFGHSELHVTPLGYGGAEIGLKDLEPSRVDELLHAVLDAGINVIDTAACYGDSEVKIGRAIADRRDEYVLITKCGHNKEDELSAEAWTGPIVSESIDRSLQRLQTDRLDVVLLHSCDAEKLDDELLTALDKARQAGKTRMIGYSGDGDDLRHALSFDLFDAIETSLNIADQQPLDAFLDVAVDKGLGVIVKRPIANAAWRNLDELGEFYSEYARPYAERIAQMGLRPAAVGFDGSWIEMALRFSAFQDGVCTAIVGSADPEHVRDNVRAVEQGPLDENVTAEIRRYWHTASSGQWVGQT